MNTGLLEDTSLVCLKGDLAVVRQKQAAGMAMAPGTIFHHLFSSAAPGRSGLPRSRKHDPDLHYHRYVSLTTTRYQHDKETNQKRKLFLAGLAGPRSGLSSGNKPPFSPVQLKEPVLPGFMYKSPSIFTKRCRPAGSIAFLDWALIIFKRQWQRSNVVDLLRIGGRGKLFRIKRDSPSFKEQDFKKRKSFSVFR